ncbi:hypothetical protein TUBRATIS_002430 [Tubulinosema ratisbonensis]|uniref:EamA domain-containing protein n=1 Tax=Tubulinosema ratisbonensis TaxID=291195 RepID=A0A437APQ9_9MICR|nr:hypothetical protein TUBRATIS_002430 [Tubulinosema ratisbonensis]
MKNYFKQKYVKISVFSMYFILGIFYAYYARAYSYVSNNFAHQAVLFDGFVLTLISFAMNLRRKKEKNKYEFFILLMIMGMFFYASKLYMNCVASLSAFIVSIFTQSRVVVTFLFHIFILRKKFVKSEFIGVVLICVFILIISFKKNNQKIKKNQVFKIKYAMLTSFSSALSGLSSCLFDSEIKLKIKNYISYSLESNFIYFLIALMYHIFYIKINNLSFFTGFDRKDFYIIAFISSSISGIAMLNCFCFSVMERMLMSFLSKIVSDLIIDILLSYKIELITCVCYFGVILGALIYKYDEITKFFKK